MKQHFTLMADYNAWANVRIYRMAAHLSATDYRRDAGAYFGSLHGTLNHLLVADRIWLHRLTGDGTQPAALNEILFEDLPGLSAARQAEDSRLIGYVQSLSDAQLEEDWDYRTLSGAPQRQRRRDILAHLFNHQTHHRGQVHAILTRLGVREPEPLDLLILQRERGGR
jgi:uncharacterized damage-inducible protein DinB